MPHRSNGFNYRAVDRAGHPVDFLLTTHRDRAAALRFLATVIRRHGVPETITSAGSGANAAALRRSKLAVRTAMGVRLVRHRAHRGEQDPRAVKRLIRPMLGYTSQATAQRPLAGIALLHRLTKGQRAIEAGALRRTPAHQLHS